MNVLKEAIPAALPPGLDRAFTVSTAPMVGSTGFDASANFCIKAFTGVGAPPPPPPPPPVPQAGAPLLADYDGDGYADPALYWSNGRFRAILSRYGYAQRGVITSYSGTQYQPISGDFDGDGYGDPAVLDRNRAQYRYISSRNGYTGRYFTQKWYWPGLRNGAGDADGDGRADLIGYEPTAPMGTWYVLLSSFNYRTYYWLEWGGVNWVPFCGNVDGDRFGDLIAYDASSRYWYVLLSSTGYTRYVYMRFNVPGKPIVGDIDGDRRADFGTYDPATGIWRILMSSYGYQYYVEATWRGN